MTGGDTPALESLVARVRGEYSEMPGLRVTFAQACRLWQVDMSTCDMLLDQLVREGFLRKTDSGFYIAAATARQRI
jgi:DNA-binding IclR family transcriptional regulator